MIRLRWMRMPASESNNGEANLPPSNLPVSPPPLPAYEQPDTERPASATPSEPVLERELPTGRDARREGHDPYAALRYGGYWLFAIAFALSVIGGQTLNVAVGWEIYNKTHSALSLGW